MSIDELPQLIDMILIHAEALNGQPHFTEMQRGDAAGVYDSARNLHTLWENLPPLAGLAYDDRRQVNHELRDRLNAVSGLAELLNVTISEDHPVHEHLSVILAAVDEILIRVNNA